MLDWTVSLLLLATAGLAVYANWKAGQPWDDLRPASCPGASC